MEHLWRIRDRATFAELRRRGLRAQHGPLAVTWIAGTPGEPPRVAFAIGRRVGKAVVRNRVRRRLRAALREVAGDLPAGAYLFSARPEAVGLTFEDLRGHLAGAIRAVTRRMAPSQGARA